VSSKVEGSAASEWRAHWPIVLAAMAGFAASTITTYSSQVFIQPLQQEFGWSRGQIASGHSIAAMAGVLFAPFTGFFVDKFGPRRLGIAAVIAICIATALLSLTGPEIWMWHALWLPMAFAIILIQPSVWTAAVTSVFAAGRGFALAVMLCGGSLASMITPKLSSLLIEALDWRMAFVALGLFWAALTLPLIYFCFSSALDRERLSPGAKENAAPVKRVSIWQSGMLTWRYPQLLIAGSCIAGVVVTLVVSLVPLLSANGLTRAQALNITPLVGISAIFGRLTIGALLDRWNGRFLAAVAVSMPIFGILLLIHYPGSTLIASIAVLIFGLSFGAELDILAYLTSRYFKVANFGLLFGTIGGFIGLASGNGPWVLQSVFDAQQSYLPALWGMIPICLVAAVLFLLLGPYPDAEAQPADFLPS
jgi:predicted MFS family arabinose efflux permease